MSPERFQTDCPEYIVKREDDVQWIMGKEGGQGFES